MLLADSTSLDIPIWIGVAAVGSVFGAFAWLGNRAVKAIDDTLREHGARLTGEAKARHDLAALAQNRHNEATEHLHRHDVSIGIIKSQLGLKE